MHDRRLCFLFGAGTSSSVNVARSSSPGNKPEYKPLIPGIDGLTELCCKAACDLGEEYKSAWETLLEQCQQNRRKVNVEDILSKVRIKIDAIGKGETLVGLDRNKLIKLENRICTTIAKTVNPGIPEDIPHNEFALWIKKVNRTVPIEIFSTNYDLLFETAFERARVPVFDGFVGTHHPFFYPECLDDEKILPTSNWVRLWKLHGSVNWVLDEGPEGKRIIRSSPSESGELILPSQRKYDESRKQPYMGYMDRLTHILNNEHAFMVTCGYSFGDEHINAIVYSSLDNCSTSNIVALQYGELSEDDDLVKVACQLSNLTVVGPNGGVISGKWGEWQLSQPVDNKTAIFMDTAFDSNALPEDKGSPAAVSPDLMGKMRIGDFNWFCRFLNSMGVITQ